MAVRAWLYCTPSPVIGEKNKLAMNRKPTRSPTSQVVPGCSTRTAADYQQQSDEHLVVQVEQPLEHALGFGQVEIYFRVVADQIVEQAGVGVLPDEALRDADSADAFGQRGRHAAEGFLHGAMRLAELAVEVAIQRPQHGHQADHEQEQHAVVPEHEGGGHEHLAQLHQADE